MYAAQWSGEQPEGVVNHHIIMYSPPVNSTVCVTLFDLAHRPWVSCRRRVVAALPKLLYSGRQAYSIHLEGTTIVHREYVRFAVIKCMPQFLKSRCPRAKMAKILSCPDPPSIRLTQKAHWAPQTRKARQTRLEEAVEQMHRVNNLRVRN